VHKRTCILQQKTVSLHPHLKWRQYCLRAAAPVQCKTQECPVSTHLCPGSQNTLQHAHLNPSCVSGLLERIYCLFKCCTGGWSDSLCAFGRAVRSIPHILRWQPSRSLQSHLAGAAHSRAKAPMYPASGEHSGGCVFGISRSETVGRLLLLLAGSYLAFSSCHVGVFG